MNIVIFGGGGQAKETIDLIQDNVKGKIVGLIDKSTPQNKILGYKILGTDKHLDSLIQKHKVTHFFVAIGDVKIRGKLYNSIRAKLIPLSIISKKANISKYAKIGEHVIIYPGVVINADVVIGNNVLINSNASIGHETKLGNNVNVNPGASIAGRVTVDDFCTIGVGAAVRENLFIAKNSTIGGGAMLITDTKPNKTYIGVPAKKLE